MATRTLSERAQGNDARIRTAKAPTRAARAIAATRAKTHRRRGASASGRLGLACETGRKDGGSLASGKHFAKIPACHRWYHRDDCPCNRTNHWFTYPSWLV